MSIARHNQRQREASWSREQCRRYLEQLHADTARMPVRRFRVEGSAGGASCLLTHEDALRTVARYGGSVVEIATVPELTAAMKAARKAASKKRK